jgi:hypothetical protein
MRKFFFYFALFLMGCAGSGDDGSGATSSSAVAHKPEITDFTLSPDTATQMDGEGSVSVTAEITFRDAGLDIQTLWVRMPDGTSIQFIESLDVETGTITENIVVATNQIGTFVVETWLVDKAGDSSGAVAAEFRVVTDVQSGDWTNRLSGLPYTLNDVIWDGDVFIAAGSGGTVMTSVDGITWVSIESGTDADLNAVAFFGSDILAVGDEIILLSTNHGDSWTVKDRPAEAILEAVAVNASQVVAGGYRWSWGTAINLISEDRGDTWQTFDSWPNEDLHMNDLVYQDGLFVASTPNPGALDARVTVSSDGKMWNEIAVSDESERAVPHTIFHDGNQFILAGLEGTVFTSPDGFNWTQLPTPVRDVFYTSAAWSGSKLVLAGPWSCGYLMGRCDSGFDIPPPVGLSTTDGGLSWQIFNIDGDYESSGLAWGDGRFVTVGRKPPFSNEGAIYTAE